MTAVELMGAPGSPLHAQNAGIDALSPYRLSDFMAKFYLAG